MYHEGILCQIKSIGYNEEELEPALAKWKIETAKQIEKDYFLCIRYGREKSYQIAGLDPDFPVLSEKLVSQKIERGGSIWTPCYELLETGPDKKIEKRYIEVAIELLLETKKARIKNFEEKEQTRLENALERITYQGI